MLFFKYIIDIYKLIIKIIEDYKKSAITILDKYGGIEDSFNNAFL